MHIFLPAKKWKNKISFKLLIFLISGEFMFLMLGFFWFFMNFCITEQSLKMAIDQSLLSSLCAYDVAIKIIESPEQNDSSVMICCHGYGGNSQKIAQRLGLYKIIPDHILSFNFPDHDFRPFMDHAVTSFGTFNELIPLLIVLKITVIDAQLPKINIYGFSAGGGAVINTLAALNSTRFDDQLKKLGIYHVEKKAIVQALENGLIILDCPLKSIDEIIEISGPLQELELVAKNYTDNDMRPIDSLVALQGLKLSILVHFQDPDEILMNRDDKLFIELLQKNNAGKVFVSRGTGGGHNSYHPELWQTYAKIIDRSA
jgi:hypothetical protein